MVKNRYISIASYIFIVLVFTAFSGCSKNETVPQTSYETKTEKTVEATEQVYLDEPDISISAAIDMETWSTNVKGGSTAIPANAHSFTLQFKFKEVLDKV